ncbi:hypothetical protein [Mycolicibacterium iranicum]|uniref:DUF998 domain-containing protein n=1 Tax=Mycolicibacterium iranicum TaxID=912594 RepID=A0A178LED3_MYCIR|nr:hypothetical protein [Mycolicibacterium iranicum]OAN28651.1 hypothetical protein A4X20_10700 [Mycolicibacterium iranicum]
MLRASGWLVNPRVTGWISLTTLLFFTAEWIVSATWRGHYSYVQDLLGPLGVPFCGPVGNWPCSRLYPLMNVSLLATGFAVTVVAASFLVQRVTDRGHAVLLMVAGVGMYFSGLFTNDVDYDWNLTAILTFMSLGSVSVLFVAMGSNTKMTVERRGVAVIAGAVSILGFLVFVGGTDLFGPGSAQRMAVYGILVAVTALGTAQIRHRPPVGRHAAQRELAGASR